MLLDILVGLILVGAMVHGLRKGFVFTFIHTVGWILALVLAYIATPYIKRILMGETTLYDSLEQDFVQRFGGSVPNTETAIQSIPGNLPDLVGDKVVNFTDSLIRDVAETFAGMVFTILVFVALVILLRIVLWTVLRLFSKDYNDGFMNFFDGLFGLIFGGLKGLLMVFVFLALLLPAINLVAPDTTAMVLDSLDHSLIAKSLYDNNFLVLILKGFIS